MNTGAMIMNDPNAQRHLDHFLIGAQQKVNEYHQKNFPTMTPPKIETSAGGQYIRVISGGKIDRSVYCFIDTTNGDILKAAGWKAPTKNDVRGNIMAADYGLSCVDHHGCIYLRG